MVDHYAQIIWNYMLLHLPLEPCQAIFILGSRDERVAEYGAQLFLDGYGKWLVISGGVGHKNDLLASKWSEGTEAEHFGAIAQRAGVPQDKILLET